MRALFVSLPEGIVRHRRWVAVAWVVLAMAVAPAAARVGDELEVAARIEGSEASDVERTVATRFGSPFARFTLLVVTGVPSPDGPAGRDALERIVAAVATVPGVRGTFSYLDVADTALVGAAGHGTFVLVGIDAETARPDSLVAPLRRATERLALELGETFPGATLRWTGEVPINFDLRRVSAEDSRRAELRVLPLTLVLLVIAFGALAASVLPLLAAALAIVITLGAAVLINDVWPMSVLIQNTVSMMGLGVGIDYALLTVGRFRDGLAAGADPRTAAAAAARHAGGTIVLSGLAVMIGFAALLFLPLSELQSIGVGGMIVVGISVLIAATLLPGLLAWLGPRVDAGRLLRRPAGGPRTGRWWRAWGRWVVAHPWLILVVAGTPVALLAWQGRRLRPDLPRGEWLPPRMESARALFDLVAMRRANVVNTLRILVELPPGVTVTDTVGWKAIRNVTEAAAADPRVARVQSLTTALPLDRPTEMGVSLLPPWIRQTMITPDGGAAIVEVLPDDELYLPDLALLVRALRGLDGAPALAPPGTRIRVGGIAALNVDYADAINSRFAAIVALVVLATVVALMIGFRSILIPIKALALNLLSVAAAFGAVVLVFQDGHGARLLGLEAPLDGVFPAVPILVFCVVFGLSMDYEVFLVSRIAEARTEHGESEAIVEGLARTGGVITSAAAIMVAVFAAFTLGDFVLIKILGFALAVAVLVDATVVRMAIGPALLRLAGRWNWWPGRGH